MEVTQLPVHMIFHQIIPCAADITQATQNHNSHYHVFHLIKETGFATRAWFRESSLKKLEPQVQLFKSKIKDKWNKIQ